MIDSIRKLNVIVTSKRLPLTVFLATKSEPDKFVTYDLDELQEKEYDIFDFFSKVINSKNFAIVNDCIYIDVEREKEEYSIFVNSLKPKYLSDKKDMIFIRFFSEGKCEDCLIQYHRTADGKKVLGEVETAEEGEFTRGEPFVEEDSS